MLISEIYKRLPKDIREKALANLKVDGQMKTGLLKDALYYGFGWETSNEGHAFWKEIHDNLPDETVI